MVQESIVADKRYVGLEGFISNIGGFPCVLRVYVSGSYWPARTVQEYHLAINQSVRVIGRCGITLIVEPTE